MPKIYSKEERTHTVCIAHFSVQEYLESERIQRQKAAIFGLSNVGGVGRESKRLFILTLSAEGGEESKGSSKES